VSLLSRFILLLTNESRFSGNCACGSTRVIFTHGCPINQLERYKITSVRFIRSFIQTLLKLSITVGHCIDNLRASLTCTPSFQPNYFVWKDVTQQLSSELEKPLEPVFEPRKCVDWNAMDAWARGRQLSLTPALLRPVKAEGRDP
jgi:hypothetical protein